MAGHFDDLKEEMVALQKQLEQRSKEVFQRESANLFKANPDLVSFSWTQYTPYFCDGDPCEFGVNDYLDLEFTDGVGIEDYSGGEYDRKYEAANHSEVNLDTADAAADLVRSIPEDVLKSVFGDHVKITVYKDQVEVEEYEHE